MDALRADLERNDRELELLRAELAEVDSVPCLPLLRRFAPMRGRGAFSRPGGAAFGAAETLADGDGEMMMMPLRGGSVEL